MNLANKLTLLRVAMVPVFVIFLSVAEIPNNYFWALIIFSLASVTDFIDGFVARKFNMITDLGKFLDPIADKVLVISALVCFTELGWTKAWVIIIIIAREFMVSGLRMLAAKHREKLVVAADFSGKLKTAFTMFAIVAALLLMALAQSGISDVFTNADFIPVVIDIMMYMCALLTVWSGAKYLWKLRFVLNN